ncbi:MAG: DUF2288 domain-containing protein [Gammaproteobacteria bacterium]|nr:DUF2288 domain-containing protein [Gammaproteobacteria bacterium]MCW8986544.1 DUF2288 domain-containing protein [Gammaproteobacteria bacterium]MCW9030753.1 DUF2288 domain-containing protein [Gammaproteobacteria bacterium]
MANDVSLQSDDELRAHLHAETSKLPWVDLEKHFARGVIFKVALGTDILDVAIVMSRDDKDTLKKWIDEGKVSGAEVDDAKKWHESSASLWTVVIAPWVLVQEIDH